MAANFSNPDSLSVLTSTLNQTLVETGRFFKSSGSMQSRSQLKRTIPVAHEQFQFALDSLSEQIFIAKAFLEKDCESIRAQKVTAHPAEDVVMGEANEPPESEVKPQPDQQQDEPETVVVKTEPQQPQPANEAAPAATQSPAAVQATQPRSTEQPIKPEKPEKPAPTVQPLAAPTEINFDSVLNDTTGGANEFDLNLDFGDDEIGNQNFLSGSSLGNARSQPPGSTALADMDTTGAGGGGGAFDMEFQKADLMPQQSDTQNGNNHQEYGMGPGESSFDDLFMDTENLGGEGMDDPNLLEGDELMNLNELEDSWFT